MSEALFVAVGGAIGSLGRYWTSLAVARLLGVGLPWGTLLINILGSFVIGAFAPLTLPGARIAAGDDLRSFVMIGLCGGYTTFSSFSLQTLGLLRQGDWAAALGNIAASVVLCLGAVAAGYAITSRLALPR